MDDTRVLMMKRSHLMKSIFGLMPILAISYCSYNFATAEQRMRQTCDQIVPNMSIQALDDFAQTRGLTKPHTTSGVTFLAEQKTFGRSACQVVLHKGVVQSVQYHFAD
jgi:hypothetical protein